MGGGQGDRVRALHVTPDPRQGRPGARDHGGHVPGRVGVSRRDDGLVGVVHGDEVAGRGAVGSVPERRGEGVEAGGGGCRRVALLGPGDGGVHVVGRWVGREVRDGGVGGGLQHDEVAGVEVVAVGGGDAVVVAEGRVGHVEGLLVLRCQPVPEGVERLRVGGQGGVAGEDVLHRRAEPGHRTRLGGGGGHLDDGGHSGADLRGPHLVGRRGGSQRAADEIGVGPGPGVGPGLAAGVVGSGRRGARGADGGCGDGPDVGDGAAIGPGGVDGGQPGRPDGGELGGGVGEDVGEADQGGGGALPGQGGVVHGPQQRVEVVVQGRRGRGDPGAGGADRGGVPGPHQRHGQHVTCLLRGAAVPGTRPPRRRRP